MEMRSILFAAGEGKRLRPLTDEVAKPGVPILDVPLGTFGLSALLGAAPPVVVNASHLGKDLEGVLRAMCPGDWELFDEGTEGFGTGGTVAALAHRTTGPIVVHNGDLITDLDPAAVLATHLESDAAITVAVRRVSTGADLVLDGVRVTEFIDRRRSPDVAGAQYVGIAVIEPDVARAIPDTRPLGLGESVFAPAAAEGRLGTHLFEGYALDVGTIERYVRANIDVLNGDAPMPPVEIPGSVFHVDGGRAYVGPGASVAEGTLGAGAVVLEGAAVAEGGRVENAVVWRKEVVPPGHKVTDAVWFEGGPLRGPSVPPAS